MCRPRAGEGNGNGVRNLLKSIFEEAGQSLYQMPVDGRRMERLLNTLTISPLCVAFATKGTLLSACKWSRKLITWHRLVLRATVIFWTQLIRLEQQDSNLKKRYQQWSPTDKPERGPRFNMINLPRACRVNAPCNVDSLIVKQMGQVWHAVVVSVSET